jgi:chemotaxis protein methyltransferase CheR
MLANHRYSISEGLRDSFISLIAQRTGIEVRTPNYSALGDNILSRIKTLHLASPMDYLNLLSQSNEEADQEWQNFVCLLTNRESYFFRDKGQMSLLKQRILPEIIQANQRTRTIRICSAGCSTGQEPYSIAILLMELLPDIENWQLKIVGVDINRESLDQGKRAMYNPWSFRQVEDHIKDQYFKNLAGYYKLNSEIQRLVRFHQVNLVRDPFHEHNPDTQNLDLIICRNVFIYFTDQAISAVMDKFHQILKPNGYLMAGHAELQNHHTQSFKGHMFPESLVYTKHGHSVKITPRSQPTKAVGMTAFTAKAPNVIAQPQAIQVPRVQPLPRPLGTTVSPLQSTVTSEAKTATDLTDIEVLIASKAYTLAVKRLEQHLAHQPHHGPGCLLMAEVQANLGHYDLAKQWCETAIAAQSLEAKPYYLLAQIAEEENNPELAKQLLKKVIYLDPNAAPAYLQLANLYQREGDHSRYQKMHQSALKILQGLPPEQTLPEMGAITVQDLLQQLT